MNSSNIQKQNRKAFNSPESLRIYSKDTLSDAEARIIDSCFIPKGKTLDIGCGVGRTTIQLARRGFEVIGIDVADKMIQEADKRYPQLDFRLMDAARLEFPDDNFDNTFFSYNGLDYLYPKENRLQALREIHRVLKPRGILAFSSHNSRFIPNTLGRVNIWLKNFVRGKMFSNYYFDYQRFGKLVTYHAPPSSQIRDITAVGFTFMDIVSSHAQQKWLLQFTDPRPYYICRK